MKGKNIIVLSEDFPPYTGGIAQWAAGVADSLQRLGHNVQLFTRFRPEFVGVKSRRYDFPVHYIHGRRWQQLRSYYCYRAIKPVYDTDGKPDVIIATTWNVARGVLPLTKKYGTKLITVVHGLEVTRKMPFYKKRWLTKTLNGSFRVISVSKFTRERVLVSYPISPDKIKVFPNGVDAELFSPGLDVSSLKKQLGLGSEKIILTLARVIERKGHDQVIKALPEVRKHFPDAKYIISGVWEEGYYRRLQNLISELDLKNAVIFTGYVHPDETRLYYNLCDVYIMPSRELTDKGDTEGFGITYLEANACEKPVIGGRSGGVVDAIVDGETGFLVDPLDSSQIARKLILLLSDAELARKLGKQGRERIEREYTWQVITRKMLEEIFSDEKQ